MDHQERVNVGKILKARWPKKHYRLSLSHVVEGEDSSPHLRSEGLMEMWGCIWSLDDMVAVFYFWTA